MKILKQLLIIFTICLLGYLISKLLPFSFPASVISMLLMLLLMLCHVIRPESIKETAEMLLGNMAFFFIPAGVNIIEHYGLIKDDLLSLFAVCFLSTFITFAITAFTVVGVIRMMGKTE